MSHAILYFPRGLSAKKEVEKQSRRVFLKQTGPLGGNKRNFFATMNDKSHI
jgi:hypothetical protein